MADEFVEWSTEDFSKKMQDAFEKNISPGLSEIRDHANKISNHIKDGNLEEAIEIVGDDKVMSMANNLIQTESYFTKIKSLTEEVKTNLKGAGNHSEYTNTLLAHQEDLSKRIADGGELIKQSTEVAIPDLEEKIALEKDALFVLDASDASYSSRLEKLQQLEESLVKETARNKELLAQETALKHFRDKQLETMLDIVKQGGTTSRMMMDISLNNSNILRTSEKNLENIKKSNDALHEMGQNKKKLLESAKALKTEAESSIDSIQSSITDTIDKLPLVGNYINAFLEKPLSDASKMIKDSLNEALEASLKTLSDTKSTTHALKAGFSSITGALKSFGSILANALLNPVVLTLAAFGTFILMLKSAYSELGKIEEAGRAFRENMGLSISSTTEIRDMIQQSRDEFLRYGVTLEDARESATALSEVFSSHTHLTQDTIDNVALIKQNFGVASEVTAGAISTMMKLGAKTGEQATKSLMHISKLSEKYGVSFSKVMSDISGASEEAMIFSGGSAKNLAKAAVEARKMGTSLEDMASAADKLLDFESSIRSEMEMNTMFGRRINLNKLISLALEGDAQKMAEEQLAILKQQGGLANMSRWQQKSIADAMGVQLSTLYDLEKTERDRIERERLLQELADSGNDLAKQKLAELNKKVTESKLSAKEQLELELQKTQELEAQKAVQDQLNAAFLELKTALLPVVKNLMPSFLAIAELLVPTFKVLGFVLGLLVKPFELILGMLSLLTGNAKVLKNMFDGWGTSLWSVFGIITGGFLFFKPLSGMFTGLFSLIKTGFSSIGSSFASIKDGFTSILKPESYKSALDKLKGFFTNSAKEASEKIGEKVTDSATEKLKDFGTDSVTDKIKSRSEDVSGSKGPSLIERFGKIDTKKLIQGAAAMGILAGALWIVSKALQEFNKVEWASVAKGTIAMGTLVGGLYGVSKALDATKSSLIKGAIALAIMGAALIPAAYGFQLFSEVSWESLAVAGVALIGLTAAVAGLGAIMSSGVGAMMLGLGAVALAGLGASLLPLAYALELATPGLLSLGIVLSKLSDIGVASLFGIAGGISAIGAALMGLGAGGGMGSVMSGVGNMLGSMGNSIAGLFGADTDKLNENPLDRILRFANESGNLQAATDALERFSVIDLSGFAVNISEDFEEKLGMVTSSLDGFFEMFKGINAGVVLNLPAMAMGMEILLSSMARNGMRIKVSMGKVLSTLSDGMADFINSLEDAKPKIIGMLPTMAVGIAGLATTLSSDIAKLPDDVDDMLELLGESIDDLFDEIDDTDFGALKYFPALNLSIIPMLNDLSKLNFASFVGVDSAMESIGKGLEELADYIDDGELEILSKFSSGSANLIAMIISLSKLAGAADSVKKVFQNIKFGLDYIAEIPYEQLSTNKIGLLKTFSVKLVDAFSVFYNNTLDPVVEGMRTLTQELYTMCDAIDKLDSEKINRLKTLSTGSTNLPPQDPFETKKVNPMVVTKPNNVESLVTQKITSTEDERLRDIFITKTGGVENFNKLIKLGEESSRALKQAFDFGKKYGTYNEASEFEADAPSYTFKDESMQAKYQELMKIRGDKFDTYFDHKRSMQDKFMDHHKASIKTSLGRDRVSQAFYKQSEKYEDMGAINTPQLDITSNITPVMQQKSQQLISDGIGDTTTQMYNTGTGMLDTQKSMEDVLSAVNTNVNSSGLFGIFSALSTFTADTFITGIGNATNAILAFTSSLESMSVSNIKILDNITKIITTEKNIESGFNSTLSEIQSTPNASESVTNISTVNQSTIQPSDQKLKDNTEVVAKLNELIGLMRTGGIAVNVDGRKVSKAIASSHD